MAFGRWLSLRSSVKVHRMRSRLGRSARAHIGALGEAHQKQMIESRSVLSEDPAPLQKTRDP
jgi:hypothetical protein